MGDGRRQRRRKNARREREASPAAADEVPDELLELVFLRLASLLHLVRAACTCKRWRRVVADSGFLRRCRSLQAVVGHYRVDERLFHPRPPGRNPVFVPSSPRLHRTSTRGTSRLSLDFLPRSGNGCCWELADSRGGLLLLQNGSAVVAEMLPSPRVLPSLVVCEPLTRRYRAIPPSAWFHGCQCFGAFLLDGDADEEAGGRISLSNFRLVCALHCSGGVARACVFSSDDGRWTASPRRTAVCGDDYWNSVHVNWFAFVRNTEQTVFWRMGSGPFGYGTRDLLILDKNTAEFSCAVDSEHIHFDHRREFMYQLAWPPTIRACLTL